MPEQNDPLKLRKLFGAQKISKQQFSSVLKEHNHALKGKRYARKSPTESYYGSVARQAALEKVNAIFYPEGKVGAVEAMQRVEDQHQQNQLKESLNKEIKGWHQKKITNARRAQFLARSQEGRF